LVPAAAPHAWSYDSAGRSDVPRAARGAVLTDTAEGKDFLLHARIATLRALNRHRVVARRLRRGVENPDRGPRRF